jgi:hypothetical protein
MLVARQVHGSPLTIRVSQSGGVAGIKRVTEGEVAPGSIGHAAAMRLLEDAPPAGPPRRRPDAFRYDVSIDDPEGELWRVTLSDPLPDDVATLLDAIS